MLLCYVIMLLAQLELINNLIKNTCWRRPGSAVNMTWRIVRMASLTEPVVNSQIVLYHTVMIYIYIYVQNLNNSHSTRNVLLSFLFDPEMLVTVTNTIHFMAQNHPHIFSAHFKDTVDILVGWHIDVTQKLSLIKYCAGKWVSFELIDRSIGICQYL